MVDARKAFPFSQYSYADQNSCALNFNSIKSHSLHNVNFIFIIYTVATYAIEDFLYICAEKTIKYQVVLRKTIKSFSPVPFNDAFFNPLAIFFYKTDISIKFLYIKYRISALGFYSVPSKIFFLNENMQFGRLNSGIYNLYNG